MDKEEKVDQTSQDGATGQNGPTVEIEGKQIPVSQLRQWQQDYANDANWKRKNEERSAELKRRERELQAQEEERQAQVETLQAELEDLKSQMGTFTMEEPIDFAMKSPAEQVKFLQNQIKQMLDPLQRDIQEKEQKRQKQEWEEYHQGLFYHFQEKHPEFKGKENEQKFADFVERAAITFNVKSGEKIPMVSLEKELALEQQESPEQMKQRIREDVIAELKGKRADFLGEPVPATIEKLEAGYENKTLAEILEEDKAQGKVPDGFDLFPELKR